jgi:hypothetical protein
MTAQHGEAKMQEYTVVILNTYWLRERASMLVLYINCQSFWMLTLYAGIKSLNATLPDVIFTGGFASWTVHFVNICVKNQHIHQLFIQFINYVW